MISDFTYLRPKSVREALSMLSELKEDAKVLAGGQSLLITMKEELLSPTHVMDIKGLSEWNFIREEKETLRIGALTSHRDIEVSPIVASWFPVLPEMEQHIASWPIRNWGTLGGNLCHGEPRSDPPALLIALGASAKLVSEKGKRTVPLSAFFVGPYETVLRRDELLSEVLIPRLPRRSTCAFSRFALGEGTFPLVSVAVFIQLEERKGTCKEARVVVGGASPMPFRATKAEEMLSGASLPQVRNGLSVRAGEEAGRQSEPVSDIYGSTEYKKEMVKVMVKRAIIRASEEVK